MPEIKFDVKLRPWIFVCLIFWAMAAPIFFGAMFYERGVDAGRADVADSCWRLRGFGVENGNMMYFFDCTKTSEKPISPWD